MEVYSNPLNLNLSEEMHSESSSLTHFSQVDQSILDSSNFKCEICFKKFDKLKNLKRHEKLHSSTKNYKCNECEMTYSRSDHLRRHQIIHSEDSKPFHCELCIQRFGNKTHLKRHIKNIHEKEKEIFKCEDCEKSFYKKSKYSKHKWTQHNDEKKVNKYSCYYPFCNKIYHSKGKLETHIENIHEKDEKTKILEKKFLRCPFNECVKTYTTPYNLKVHIKTFHYEVEEFKCGLCNSQFKHKCSLDKHINKFHQPSNLNFATSSVLDINEMNETSEEISIEA